MDLRRKALEKSVSVRDDDLTTALVATRSRNCDGSIVNGRAKEGAAAAAAAGRPGVVRNVVAHGATSSSARAKAAAAAAAASTLSGASARYASATTVTANGAESRIRIGAGQIAGRAAATLSLARIELAESRLVCGDEPETAAATKRDAVGRRDIGCFTIVSGAIGQDTGIATAACDDCGKASFGRTAAATAAACYHDTVAQAHAAIANVRCAATSAAGVALDHAAIAAAIPAACTACTSSYADTADKQVYCIAQGRVIRQIAP